MSGCHPGALEAHLRGEAHGQHDLAEHLRGCAACQRELSWLRAEHRLFSERARDLAPPYVQLATLRGQVDRRIGLLARAQRRARALRSGGAVLSALGTVVVAFFIATVPTAADRAQLGWLDPESCSSVETGLPRDAVCQGAPAGRELIAAVEGQFEACLLATPGALPTGICR